MPQGAPVGMHPPMAPAPVGAPGGAPPAADGALALAQLAPQQQSILDAVRQQLAREAMGAAMSAIGGLPSPAAAQGVTEPAPPMQGAAPMDQSSQGTGY